MSPRPFLNSVRFHTTLAVKHGERRVTMPIHVRLTSSCHTAMVVVVANDAIASTVGSNSVCLSC